MIASALASSQIGKYTRSRQRLWLQAIETRTGAISETLASIKGLKMLGLTSSISKYLQALREKELEISKRFRKLQISNIFMGMPIFLSHYAALTVPSRKFASLAVTNYHLHWLWDRYQALRKRSTKHCNCFLGLVALIHSHRPSE